MSFKRYYRFAFRYGTWKRFAFYYSQGNISNFADSRPEERRVIFEEAAGVSKYKKRKIEAIRKLERTTDNLNRIKDIVYELEKQIAPLKKQKEKAEVFLNVEGKTYFNRK